MPSGTLYGRLGRGARFKLWWRRRARTRAAVIVVVGVVIVVFFLILLLPRPRQHEVSGRVECASGRAVTGVWVQDLDGDDSHWAEDRPDPQRRNTVGYRADIKGDHYQLHVGCGGTPRGWAVSAWSGEVSGPTNDLACSDVGTSGTCRVTH